MTTYVIRNGELVEKHLAAPLPLRSMHVMGDIQPFVSPIDKTVITSRSQVREHERKHNVYQIGNDWCGREKPAFWDQLKR